MNLPWLHTTKLCDCGRDLYRRIVPIDSSRPMGSNSNWRYIYACKVCDAITP